MAKKESKNIVFLHIILAVITIVIGAVFIYRPFLDSNKSLRDQILDERDKNILVGKISALDKHLNIYKKRIPEGRGVSWLLNTVSDIAAKGRIDVTYIKPGMPDDRGLYTQLHVVLDTVSTYHNLGQFISNIESSEKFLRVESIKMKRLDLDEDFNAENTKFQSFDVKSEIVISTIVLKD